ncbi:MAG: ABC transporter ATP-binding protein [Candidatus Aminicenantales bacterium]
MDEQALIIKNLTKTFETVKAVNNVSLEVEKGKVFGLIGPDGAGKTTLLRLIAGLLRPEKGSLLVAGIDVVKEPQRIKTKIGYMPQHFSLYGDLTVGENLKFFADIYLVPEAQLEERKRELLHFSQLAPFEKRLARNLSGGMQKKLALACNLFHTPEILLLDEPTTGVDPISRKELWQILSNLNQQGVTIIFTTPYMDEAQKCHKVGLIHRGRIIACETPRALIEGMEDEVIEIITEQEKARSALQELKEVKSIYPFGEALHLLVEKESLALSDIKEVLSQKGIAMKSARKISPSFEDVFLAILYDEKSNQKGK